MIQTVRDTPSTNGVRVFGPGHPSNDAGTGLELSVVRQIAEAHDWSVTITDGPDGGTTFEFTGVVLYG